eukprot:Gb_29042 [translate_table: standard]
MSSSNHDINSSTEQRHHPSPDGFDERKEQLRGIHIVKKTQEDRLNCVAMDEKYEEPLSPQACLLSEQLLETYILGIVGFKKEIEVNSLKNSLQASLGQHQRFSSVVIKDKQDNLKWCLTEVDINDHVIVPCLSPEFIQNPNFVNEYTASLATAPPLNPSRPLWEVHVLNATSGQAAATLVFRIHHCVGDCVSMLSLIVNSTRTVSDPKSLPTIPPHHKSKDKKRLGFAQTMYNWVAAFCLTFITALNYLATLLWRKDSSCLKAVSPGKVSAMRMANVALSMNDIGLVRKVLDGTVNDVMMGVLSAGLVRYVSRRYAKDAESEVLAEKTANGEKLADRTDHLPPNLHIRALVAVNKRGSPILEVMACICRRLLSNTSLGFSNVIGPVEEIEYGDNPVAHIIPTAHVNHAPIIIHFISYAGKGRLIVLVSEYVISDPQVLCMDCADALQQMKQAALLQIENSIL